MSFVDVSVWIAGLGLQSALLFFLFRRRLVFQVPVFSLLIAFYLVRAGVLFGLYSHLARDDYNELYNALSTFDLVLQILVATEITVKILRSGKVATKNHGLKLAAMILAGVALAITAAALVPLRGPLPVDRGMVFITIGAILLVIWMAVARLRGMPRRIAEGFALYGLAGIFAAFERSYAMLHRSTAALAAASYVQTSMYICVVAFWLITVLADRTRRGADALAA